MANENPFSTNQDLMRFLWPQIQREIDAERKSISELPRTLPIIEPAEGSTTYTDLSYRILDKYVPSINRVSAALGISPRALAGAFVEEIDSQYNDAFWKAVKATTQGIAKATLTDNEQIRAKYDAAMDAINRGENPDAFFAKLYPHHVMLDIGEPSIEVRTAISVLDRYVTDNPRSDPLDLKYYQDHLDSFVKDIVDNPDVTAKVGGLIIKEATDWMAARVTGWHSLPASEQDALLVYYYNVGRKTADENFRLHARYDHGQLYYVPNLDKTPIAQDHLRNAGGIEEALHSYDVEPKEIDPAVLDVIGAQDPFAPMKFRRPTETLDIGPSDVAPSTPRTVAPGDGQRAPLFRRPGISAPFRPTEEGFLAGPPAQSRGSSLAGWAPWLGPSTRIGPGGGAPVTLAPVGGDSAQVHSPQKYASRPGDPGIQRQDSAMQAIVDALNRGPRDGGAGDSGARPASGFGDASGDSFGPNLSLAPTSREERLRSGPTDMRERQPLGGRVAEPRVPFGPPPAATSGSASRGTGGLRLVEFGRQLREERERQQGWSTRTVRERVASPVAPRPQRFGETGPVGTAGAFGSRDSVARRAAAEAMAGRVGSAQPEWRTRTAAADNRAPQRSDRDRPRLPWISDAMQAIIDALNREPPRQKKTNEQAINDIVLALRGPEQARAVVRSYSNGGSRMPTRTINGRPRNLYGDGSGKERYSV